MFVVHMMTVHVRANLEMLEEFPTGPRVFGQNQIHFFQNANRTESHVFKIANGRGNYVKFGHLKEFLLYDFHKTFGIIVFAFPIIIIWFYHIVDEVLGFFKSVKRT